ncbi:MAG: hypothetical protein CVV10_03930 [Gammaproteobacteria bacterium HGW-Gammaproteobacteria-14]|nr:MAG: hypothetical protein CVV10_03930 [Gammaproteobacteria bacterium HGW-Gammaproteobacteria-14]
MTARTKNMMMMALIVAPFALTFAFVHLFVDLDKLDRVNKGSLIIPHVAIESLQPTNSNGDAVTADSLAGKWTLLYIAAGECDTACKNGLYYLIQQLRLGLGSDAPRVRRVIAHSAPPQPSLRDFLDNQVAGMIEISVDAEALRSNLGAAFPESTNPENHIYLMAPDGQIFMWYPSHEDMEQVLLEADKLLYDLKRTLKGSLIG